MTGLDKTLRQIVLVMVAVVMIHAHVAEAATMSVTVAQQSVAKGDTVLVDWYLDTEGQPINVVDATIYFSPETLSINDISTGSSSLVLWIERPVVVSPGVIHFVGGIPGGVTGSHIPVLQTILNARAVGNASIVLGKHSIVAQSNGLGTNTAITMEPVVFPIVASMEQSVVSATHPHQDEWYRSDHVTFTIKEKGPVSYSFSANQEIVPTAAPTVMTTPIVYDHVPDGIYYFKVAAPVDGGLQELQTYRVLIDHIGPTISDAQIDRTNEIFNGKPSLSFYAVDKTAGVAYVKVKTGWFGFYHRATSPYRLHKPLFGNVVKIHAYDVAGNSTLSTVYFRGYLANWVSYCVTLVVLLWIVYIIIQKRTRIRLVTKKVLRQLRSQHSSS